MKNIKYHSINIIAVMVFSLVTSAFVREIIVYSIGDNTNNATGKKNVRTRVFTDKNRASFDSYASITTSGFFPPEEVNVPTEGPDTVDANSSSSLSDLSLIGTITGPYYMARALIQKRGEQSAQVFALYKVNKQVQNDVYGYKLVRISPSRVYLKKGSESVELDLYAERVPTSRNNTQRTVSNNTGPTSNTLSRAAIMQNASNMMDLSRGLVISPHRVNGQVEGFRLKTIRPYNVLHKLGFRPGDIIKRINGKKIDTMPKAMGLWSQLKSESSINVDIERGGKDTNMNFTITD